MNRKNLQIITTIFTTIFLLVCLTSCIGRYELTLDLDGGNINGKTDTIIEKVKKNKSFALPTPTKEDYEFIGWFTLDDIEFTNESIIKQDITLKAKWTSLKYHVTLVLNGGTITSSDQSLIREVSKNSSIDLPNVVLTNYQFNGWFTEDGTLYDNNTIITKDVTLYARFSQPIILVSYQNASLFNGYTSHEQVVEDFLNDLLYYNNVSISSNEFYNKVKPIFIGENGMFSDTVMQNKWKWLFAYLNDHVSETLKEELVKCQNNQEFNQSLFIQELHAFLNKTKCSKLDQVNPSYDYTGLTIEDYITYYNELAGSNQTEYLLGNSYTLRAPLYQLGRVFLGWYDEQGKPYYSITNEKDNLNLTAHWSLNYSKITYQLQGGTQNEHYIDSFVVGGNVLTLTEPTKEGYRFNGWQDNEGNIVTTTENLTKSTILKATWIEAIYNISYHNASLSSDDIYESREELVNDFINDITIFYKVRITAENFYNKVKNSLFTSNGFFSNKVMNNKWIWLLNYLKTTSLTNTRVEIEAYLSGSNINNENLIKQEIQGFLTKTKCSLASTTSPSADYTNTSKANNYIDDLVYYNGVNLTTYRALDTFILRAPKAKAKQLFLGWYYKDTLITEINETMKEDLVLEAKWTENYYEIDYDLLGGQFTNEYFDIYIPNGTTYLLPNPVKTGLVFMGWLKNNERIKEITVNDYQDLNLTAKWGYGYCYVKYYNYNNTLLYEEEVEKNELITEYPLDNYLGLDLKWFDGRYIYDFTKPVMGDLALYARWEVLEDAINQSFPAVIEDDLNIKTTYSSSVGDIKIEWVVDNPHIINTYNGLVNKPSVDQYVKIYGYFMLNKVEIMQSFECLVKKQTFKSLSNIQPVFAYMANYMSYFKVNEQLTKTVDVIIYGFARVNNDFTINLSELGYATKVLEARKEGIRVLLCVGAYGAACKSFSDAAATEEGRKTLAKNIVDIVVEYGYDGVDVDWEYPGYLTGRDVKIDRPNYTLLMAEIRKQLDEINPDYLLTAAIPGGTSGYVRFELAKLNNIFDYIHLMTYDLQNNDKVTHHTPLYYDELTTQFGSVSQSVERFVFEGVSANKLVAGIAFYGRTYYLKEAPSSDSQILGFTKIKASSSNYMNYTNIYNDYIKKIDAGSTTIKYFYDEKAHAPYIYDSNQLLVITYDSPLSVSEKCQYVKDNELGGVMFWEYSEDQTGQLLEAIYNTLKK